MNAVFFFFLLMLCSMSDREGRQWNVTMRGRVPANGLLTMYDIERAASGFSANVRVAAQGIDDNDRK